MPPADPVLLSCPCGLAPADWAGGVVLTRHFRQLTESLLLLADVVAVIDPADPSHLLPLYPSPAAPYSRSRDGSLHLLLVKVDRRYRDEQVRMVRESLAALRRQQRPDSEAAPQ